MITISSWKTPTSTWTRLIQIHDQILNLLPKMHPPVPPVLNIVAPPHILLMENVYG